MAHYIKREGVWTPVTTTYAKLNGSWVVIDEATTQAYLTTVNADFYKGDAPTTKYVTNLLPQYTTDYWNFEYFNGGNYNYPPSSYAGESVRPSGNVVVLFTRGDRVEAFINPKEAYYPPLVKGHQYYVRWMSRKELITDASGNNGSSNNINVSEDVFWPEQPNNWIQDLNNSSYNLWRLNGTIITPNQSQWPSVTTPDGNYKIRFDCNNRGKYVKYWCTADFMLIDLTKDYTNQGYNIPTLAALNAKPYFYGQMDITTW